VRVDFVVIERERIVQCHSAPTDAFVTTEGGASGGIPSYCLTHIADGEGSILIRQYQRAHFGDQVE
jgi:hypothetical protein